MARAASSAPVGLAHDYLLVMRGAERTFAAIADTWPGAPIYTLLHDPAGTNGAFAGRTVVTSPLQRLGVRQRGFRRLLPLFPAAVERLPVAGHDVVVSSSSAWAHGLRARADACHVCYCHSPFRYVWHERERALSEAPAPLRPVAARVLERIRRWDVGAAARVTHYVANSRITAERIAAFYGLEAAAVVHPPVEVDRFRAPAVEPEDWFLLVSEVTAHKRIEVALEAASRAGARVRVVGEGPDLARLRARYAGTAEFLGRVGDEELASLYARCRAFAMPAIEEFGIAAVEAQAAGRPVLAAAAGGALETVADGETGVHVPPGDAGAFAEAMRAVDWDRFDPAAIRARAERFAPERFRERLRAEVERLCR
jgi:glycosyltransferase involved in cell wall biosynthesis